MKGEERHRLGSAILGSTELVMCIVVAGSGRAPFSSFVVAVVVFGLSQRPSLSRCLHHHHHLSRVHLLSRRCRSHRSTSDHRRAHRVRRQPQFRQRSPASAAPAGGTLPVPPSNARKPIADCFLKARCGVPHCIATHEVLKSDLNFPCDSEDQQSCRQGLKIPHWRCGNLKGYESVGGHYSREPLQKAPGGRRTSAGGVVRPSRPPATSGATGGKCELNWSHYNGEWIIQVGNKLARIALAANANDTFLSEQWFVGIEHTEGISRELLWWLPCGCTESHSDRGHQAHRNSVRSELGKIVTAHRDPQTGSVSLANVLSLRKFFLGVRVRDRLTLRTKLLKAPCCAVIGHRSAGRNLHARIFSSALSDSSPVVGSAVSRRLASTSGEAQKKWHKTKRPLMTRDRPTETRK